MRQYTFILCYLLLVACHPLPESYFNGWYYGIASGSKCLEMSRISAQIFNGTFSLYVGQYHIRGLFDPIKRNLTGEDSNDAVITFSGQVAGPFFGKLFSGTINDHGCKSYIEASPPIKT